MEAFDYKWICEKYPEKENVFGDLESVYSGEDSDTVKGDIYPVGTADDSNGVRYVVYRTVGFKGKALDEIRDDFGDTYVEFSMSTDAESKFLQFLIYCKGLMRRKCFITDTITELDHYDTLCLIWYIDRWAGKDSGERTGYLLVEEDIV